MTPPPTMTAPLKTKISVSLTDEAARTVEDLATKKRVPVSEIIRRGIALERFIEEELEQGATFLIRRPDGELERVHFVFS